MTYKTTERWYGMDCEPYRDPSKVIEAARDAERILDYFANERTTFVGSGTPKSILKSLSEAIRDYDNQEENEMDEYKWLAMDVRPRLWKVRPEYTGFTSPDKWWGCAPSLDEKFKHVDNPPPFLKPGQLWELTYEISEFGNVHADLSCASWNGYWWRLVEDHSVSQIDKDETQDKKNIVDETQGDACIKISKTRLQKLVDQARQDGWIKGCELGRSEGDYFEGWEEGVKAGQKQPVNANLYEAVKILLENYFWINNIEELKADIDTLSKTFAKSTPVKPQEWITGRNPTEKDGYIDNDGDSWVLVFEECGEFPTSVVVEHVGDRPWLPLNHIRPAEQPKTCETCEHRQRMKYQHKVHYPCALVGTFNPHYGMDGCKYKRKEVE